MPSCSPLTLFCTPLKSGRLKNRRKASTSSAAATSASTLKRGRNDSDSGATTNTSLDTSGKTSRKASHESDSGTSPSLSSATEYVAPYYRLPCTSRHSSDQTYRPPDLIYFRKGHTLEEHLQAIGQTKENFRGQFQSFIVSRYMNEEELERVRRDPGVEKVVQVTEKMEEKARSKHRTLVKQHGSFRPAPGYFVSFFHRALSMRLHFMRIGQRLDHVTDLRESGYFVECLESQLEKIFRDPNVCLIEQNSYGKFC